MINKLLFLSLLACILLASTVECLDKSRHCKCKVKTSSRIIGGRIAGKTDYPWMVSISLEENVKNEALRKMLPDPVKVNTHSCGGIILNENWILTAAHCQGPWYSKLHVGYGHDNDLVKIFEATRTKVAAIHVHPDFGMSPDGDTMINDIALLELSEPIEFSEQVLPGCLDTNSWIDYKDVMITGYGFTSKVLQNPNTGEMHKGDLSRYLKELEYKDMSSSSPRCSKYRGLLCVDSKNKGESGCMGDSGGPMHKTINGKTTIVGLTSGSDYYEKIDDYIVHCNGIAFYTRVGAYIDWIEETIGGSQYHC